MDRLECDRIFVAVVETRSFTQAARQHGISPGQASKMVSRLEERLGVQLLARTTRAVAPSDAGRVYYERIRELIDEVEALDGSLRAAEGAVAGRLRLTAPETFGVTQLAPVLIAFSARHPQIQLDVRFSDSRVNLIDEGFDLAVRIGNPSDSTLIARRLCDAPIVTVAAPEHLEARGVPQTPGDLAGYECIIDTNFEEPLAWTYRVDGRPLLVGVRGRLRFSNAQACRAAAVEGLGVARLPGFVAVDALRQGRLHALLNAYAPPPLAVHALYPAGRAPSRRLRVLLDFLAAAFAARPDETTVSNSE